MKAKDSVAYFSIYLFAISYFIFLVAYTIMHKTDIIFVVIGFSIMLLMILLPTYNIYKKRGH
jgi:hypothetical protein